MAEYQDIKAELQPTLERGGFVLSSEEVNSDEKGLFTSIFIGKACEYRITWNELNGQGIIEYKNKGAWKSFCISVPRHNETEYKLSLVKLRVSLIEHIALSKLKK